MNIIWLRYFVMVAEELSFTKAALRLRITQPPLSRHIQELENALGAELFFRHRRPLELTPAGQALLPEARIAISAFEHALETAQRVSRLEAGKIRIAVAASLAGTAELVVAEHRKWAPNIKIEYSDIFSRDQCGNLQKYGADIGFLRGQVGEALNFIHLFSERIYVLLPTRHVLCGKTSIKLQELEGESVLLQDPQISQICGKVLELYAKAGVCPGPLSYFTGSWLRPANQLRLKTEEQICFGMDNHLELTKDRIAVPLEEPDASYPAFLAWRKEERSAGILGFIDSARRIFGQKSNTKPKRISQDKDTREAMGSSLFARRL